MELSGESRMGEKAFSATGSTCGEVAQRCSVMEQIGILNLSPHVEPPRHMFRSPRNREPTGEKSKPTSLGFSAPRHMNLGKMLRQKKLKVDKS